MARVGRVAGRGATVAWLLFAISLVRTPGVAALCGEIPDPEAKLAGGEIAFVGVAEYVTGTYWAGFHVEEVWFDGDLPEWLEVAGSPEEKPWVTDLLISVGSTDRSWKVGSRYLAFPRAFGGRLFDGECSGTTEWHEGLADLRPATAHAPVPTARPLSWIPAVSGLLLLIGVPLIALAQTRQSR